MSAHKGFTSIIAILIISISFVLIYLVAWAPWVSLDFARQKALSSMDKSCRELSSNEYSDNNPYEIRSLTLGEQLGLTPSFGQDVTFYVLCGETSSKNTYFISFLGTVKLKESIPIPHRVSVEQPQNTIEKIDETTNPDQIGADWKTYTNTKLGFSIKYPQDFSIKESESFITLDSKDLEYPKTESALGEILKGGIIIVNASTTDAVNLDELVSSYKQNTHFNQFQKTKLNGQDAWRFLFEPVPNYQKSPKIISLKNGKEYTLEAYFAKDDKEKVSDIFNQIVSTFKFLN